MKYIYTGTEEQLIDNLREKYGMNSDKEIELIKFVCYGEPTEIQNYLQCDFYGNELDFTLKYEDDYDHFKSQVEEIIQDLLAKGLVKVVG